MEKSTTEPWMPADEYGHSLPTFTINLLVLEIPRAVEFYETVLGGSCHYQDEDFAALNVAGLEFMLHADHTYEVHPWVSPLKHRELRGLGAELHLMGLDPDEVETSARKLSIEIVQAATTKAHGWREVMVSDPDGYVWAVGIKT